MSADDQSKSESQEQQQHEQQQQQQPVDSSISSSSAIKSQQQQQQEEPQVDYKSVLDSKPTYCAAQQQQQLANRPERLVLCVDASTEFAVKAFRLRSGETSSLLDVTLKSFHLLAQNKLRLGCGRHQLALAAMRGNRLSVLQPLTSSAADMAKSLSSHDLRDLLQQPAGDEAGDFSLDCLLDYVRGQLPLPEGGCLLRVVLLCCRSKKPPRMSQRLLAPLLAEPSLFFDILYVHEPPAVDNAVEETFRRLCCLESEHGRSYIHEVLNNPTAFFNQAATFLAHPLQRPAQSTASYRLQRPPSAEAAVCLPPLAAAAAPLSQPESAD